MTDASRTTESNHLQAQIAHAFPDTAYPPGMRIAIGHDRYPDYEGNRANEFLEGKKWQELTYESLRDAYSADGSALIHFLTDDGFRYYLPAFLTMALEPAVAGDIVDTLASALTFPPDADDKFARRIGALRPARQKAVVDVLRFMASYYDREGYPDNPARSALQTIEVRLGRSV